MKFLLDTDICIYLIRKQPPSVIRRLRTCSAGDAGLSAITVSELRYGASKSSQPRKNHEALDLFFAPFEIAAFDESCARTYGEIRARLERAGVPIGPLDMLIAAHANRLGATLVTNSVSEFRRVEGLNVETWT